MAMEQAITRVWAALISPVARPVRAGCAPIRSAALFTSRFTGVPGPERSGKTIEVGRTVGFRRRHSVWQRARRRGTHGIFLGLKRSLALTAAHGGAALGTGGYLFLSYCYLCFYPRKFLNLYGVFSDADVFHPQSDWKSPDFFVFPRSISARWYLPAGDGHRPTTPAAFRRSSSPDIQPGPIPDRSRRGLPLRGTVDCRWTAGPTCYNPAYFISGPTSRSCCPDRSHSPRTVAVALGLADASGRRRFRRFDEFKPPVFPPSAGDIKLARDCLPFWRRLLQPV